MADPPERQRLERLVPARSLAPHHRQTPRATSQTVLAAKAQGLPLLARSQWITDREKNRVQTLQTAEKNFLHNHRFFPPCLLTAGIPGEKSIHTAERSVRESCHLIAGPARCGLNSTVQNNGKFKQMLNKHER